MLRILIAITLFGLVWSLQAQSQSPLFIPAPGSPFVVGEGSGRILLADVNGDGRLDLLTCHLLQKFVGVDLMDGAGRFVAAPGSPIAMKTQPGDIKVADLNGDKIPDLAVTHSDGRILRVDAGRRALPAARPFARRQRGDDLRSGEVILETGERLSSHFGIAEHTAIAGDERHPRANQFAEFVGLAIGIGQ